MGEGGGDVQTVSCPKSVYLPWASFRFGVGPAGGPVWFYQPEDLLTVLTSPK